MKLRTSVQQLLALTCLAAALPARGDNAGISSRSTQSSSITVLRDGQYSLATDPMISAEFAMDEPVWSPQLPTRDFEPAVAAGDGSYLVVWRHDGYPRWDVYGARVSSTGDVLDPAGLVITPPTGARDPSGGSIFGSPTGRAPAVAWDGQNYLVLWQDSSDVWTYAVYAARVSASGQLLDPDGIVVARGPLREQNSDPGFSSDSPAVAWNGEAYLAVWDHPGGISGARVTAAGAVLDPNPIAISIRTDESRKKTPALTWDGQNYVVVWADAGTIAGIRMSAEGVLLAPLALPSSSDNGQSRPAVSSSGQESLVVWEDGYVQIYGARIGLDGQALDPAGFPISVETGFDPAVAWTGSHYQVVWSTSVLEMTPPFNPFPSSVLGATVTPGGQVLDPQGVMVSPSTDYAVQPAVAWNGQNSLVAWSGRSREGYAEYAPVHAARLGSDGQLEDGRVIVMTSVKNSQSSPAASFSGAHSLVVWSDRRGGRYDIYGVRVQPDGTVLDPTAIPIGVNGWWAWPPAVASDGQDFFVVWQGSTHYDDLVFGARVTAAGTLLDPEPIPITANGDEHEPQIASIGAGNYLIVYSSAFPAGVFSVRINGNGQPQNPAPISLDSSANLPHVASNGHGYFVVWTSGASIQGAAVSLDGTAQAPVLISATPPASRVNLTLASDGDSYLVAWSDFQSQSFTDTFTAQLSPDGEVLALTKVATQFSLQDSPALAWDGQRYLLAWSDELGTAHQVLGLRVDREGQALDPAPLVLVPSTSEPRSPVNTAAGPPGECLVTYAALDAELGLTRVKARIVKNDDLNPPPVPEEGDFNADGRIDSADLNILLGKIRARSTDLTYDVNGDGLVSIADARYLVLHFSKTSPQ